MDGRRHITTRLDSYVYPGDLSNQHGLKILHKGSPSSLSPHILPGRPPAWRGPITAYLKRAAGRKEAQGRGAEDGQMEAGNTMLTRTLLHVRHTRPRKQHACLLTCTRTHTHGYMCMCTCACFSVTYYTGNNRPPFPLWLGITRELPI